MRQRPEPKTAGPGGLDSARCRLGLLPSAAALALAAALAAPGSGAETWYEHYGRALDLISNSRDGETRVELERALELRSEPGLKLRTEGVSYIDYLPHLYLAVAAPVSGARDAEKGDRGPSNLLNQRGAAPRKKES